MLGLDQVHLLLNDFDLSFIQLKKALIDALLRDHFKDGTIIKPNSVRIRF